LNKIQEQLKIEVTDLCKSAEDTPLPPLRAINHIIPIIDESKIYRWHPSQRPEAIRPFWNEK
jgi:hypothetical protein